MGEQRRKLVYFMPASLLYLLLIGGGMLQVFKESLGYIPTFQMNQWTLSYYGDIFRDISFIKDFAYSLYIAATATTVSVVAGILIAFYMVQSNRPLLKWLFNKVMYLGMILPYLYMVFIITLSFSRTGIWSRLLYQLSLISSLEEFPILTHEGFGIGIILTYVFKGIPFVTLFLMNVMGNISRQYDDVALNLGSSKSQLLKEVYLPLSGNMIVWSSMVLFAYDYGSFEVPYLLATQSNPTLSIRLFSAYITPSIETIPKTMAMAMILFVTGIVFVYLYSMLVRWFIHIKHTYRITSRFHREITKMEKLLGSLSRLMGGILIVGAVIVGVYMIMLSLNSYFRYPVILPQMATLVYWKNLLGTNSIFYKSLYSSFLVAGVTAAMSTIVGFITGRGISKYYKGFKHKALMLISIPLFIPGMSLFLGAHQVLIHSIFANHWFGIVLVHMLVCLPYTTNIGIAYFDGIPRELEQVAKTLGTGKFRLYQKLFIPILAPGLFLSMIVSFLISNTEYFSTFLLGGGNTVTFSLIMYPYIANADMNMTSVLGIVFLLVHLIIFLLLDKLLRRKVSVKALYD